jgi:peptide chain release factor subunit 1
MTNVPVDTRLSPDQQRLRAVMRELAELESPDAPVLSLYADLRPELQGGDPGARNELTVVRHRLADLLEHYEPHTTAHTSLRSDIVRFEAYLSDQADALRSAEGLALFACGARDTWEAIVSPTPFETQVGTGPTADLFQLGGLLEESRTVVVALVDTHECRLYVTRRGSLVEGGTLDEDKEPHSRHDQGGWSQARYQRSVDMADKRFAAEAAAAIGELIDRVRAHHFILAGEERTTSVLVPELPESARAVLDHVARIDMHANAADVEADVAPMIAALQIEDAQEAAERAIAGWRAGDLGVVGVDAVQEALERGQVHELVIDESSDLDETIRTELVRQAMVTGAQVVTIHGDERLVRHQGVAATLRFRMAPGAPERSHPGHP